MNWLNRKMRPNLKLVPRLDLKPEPKEESLIEALVTFILMLGAFGLLLLFIYTIAPELGFPE